MITLENKCTLVALFDALAYQHPSIPHKHNINSPLDLVRCMLEGEGSNWDVNDKLTKLKNDMINGIPHPNSTFIWFCACKYLRINMCVPDEKCNEVLCTVSPTAPTIYGIRDAGHKHVAFKPFPYVRIKRDQELFQHMNKNSQKEMQEQRERYWY